MREYLPKARHAFAYGYGWPVPITDNTANGQIGVERSGSLFRPVFGSWEGKVASYELAGEQIIITMMEKK